MTTTDTPLPRPSVASAPTANAEPPDPPARQSAVLPPTAVGLAAAALAACGGGATTSPDPDTPPVTADPPTALDASRFLSQAAFGVTSVAEVDALRREGYEAWLARQFSRPAPRHLDYLAQQRRRTADGNATDEMSYEAIWQQWLRDEAVLRSRVGWAWLQILVISNIAPDLRPHAMSSYVDTIHEHAFGNFRELLEAVTLHPAMGYYLNMLESERADPERGTHPNENYAREVLQLFSLGLVKLQADGRPALDAEGRTQPTYDETVVKGFARAFTGWSFGALNNQVAREFHEHDENDESLWVVPMKAWKAYHATGRKVLLDGLVLPEKQTPEQDMADALDCICNHPNVGPFLGRQLIQRLVTSNPAPEYVARVAAVWADNGQGVRGDLQAVVRAVLLDPLARGDSAGEAANFGKLREPVLRFAHVLRALGARSANGLNSIHYLDSADDALGQSPLLAPSVFNFYSPQYRPAGALAAAGLVAPEFQITSETSLAGSLNFFATLFDSGGYGDGDSRLQLDYSPLLALAGTPSQLVTRLDMLFFARQMSVDTRERMLTLLQALPADYPEGRVTSALKLMSLSPDFVIQR